jgi:hypothetical protein
MRHRDVTNGCFPGATVMVALLEDESSLYRGMAYRYLLHAGPEAEDMPEADLMALSELPSVDAAMAHGQLLYEGNAHMGLTG